MYNIKGTFLDSKVARRMLFLFLIAALLPITILAFFSARQVNAITAESVNADLRQNAKNYGLLIHERLMLLNEKLTLHFADQSPTQYGKFQNKKMDSFSQLHVFKLDSLTYLSENKLPALSGNEQEFLKQGKPVLMTKFRENLPAELYLLHLIENTQLVVMGMIKNDALWGRAETFDDSQGFCIYGNDNKLLFCSQIQLDAQLQNVKSAWVKTTTGNLNFTDGKQDLLVGFWSLFLRPSFFYPGFTIAITADQEKALASSSGLTQLFIVVSLLTLIIILFLSTIQIRRYLTPIQELMRGIQRIAKNDFNHPVQVKTDDEFHELAGSFNSMSNQLSHHFEFLTTIAKIDQSILSNNGIQDILATIISLGNKAVHSETVNIAMASDTDDELLDIYAEDIHHVHGVSMVSDRINPADKHGLMLKKTALYRINNDVKLPSFLTALIQENIASFILVPIVSNEKLTAILIFGFHNVEFSPESHFRLRELGDRFAIALEKATWNRELYLQANYDSLTQLPNRQRLNEHLQQAIKRSNRDNSHFSLMFIDLDRFKTVNDSLGHASGDKLLKMVADRLNSTLSDDDTVARLGGDEFIVLLAPSDENEAVYSRSTLIASQVLETLSNSYTIDNQELHISASIGIATYPNDGEDLKALLKNADSAMYHAKTEGRNNFQFYSHELNQMALQQLKMQTELHNAIANDEFQMYYQAKVNTKTGQIVGAEALIRWFHPTNGLIPPFQFMPIVEKSGLIKKLGEWTLRESCRQNKQWQEQGLMAIPISVNLSPIQFQQKNLVKIVEQALDDADLSANYLNLEILENTEMKDPEKTIYTLNSLRNLGVSISIDDYGTGHSTLSYLKKFPVDVLKMDMSFIKNLHQDLGDQAIVASTVLLAHNLGIKVVAEGVENAEQLVILQELNCDEVQGYYYSRPVPARDFANLLANVFIDPND